MTAAVVGKIVQEDQSAALTSLQKGGHQSAALTSLQKGLAGGPARPDTTGLHMEIVGLQNLQIYNQKRVGGQIPGKDTR